MHGLGWTLVLCAAVSVTLAGFCTEEYTCGRECTGRWFRRRCGPRLCTRNICCAGFHGVSCSLDTDECLENHHGCSHNCTNTHGSYKCTCPSGYVLLSDQRECEGHWCTRTHSCYKTKTAQACTKRWWKTRCRTYTITVHGTCSTKECCPGWSGHDCHIPVSG